MADGIDQPKSASHRKKRGEERGHSAHSIEKCAAETTAVAGPCCYPFLLLLLLLSSFVGLIHNVYAWRLKETERMKAIVAECTKLGATVEEFRDYYCIIHPPARRQQNQRQCLDCWARPTGGLDQFGDELLTIQYPESLVVEARERMGEVINLERRRRTFLADNRSASHPLRPMMDRPLRKFDTNIRTFGTFIRKALIRNP